MHILQNILWDQVCPQLNILLISKHKAQAATAAHTSIHTPQHRHKPQTRNINIQTLRRGI